VGDHGEIDKGFYLGLGRSGVEAKQFPGPARQRRAPHSSHSKGLGRRPGPVGPLLYPADLSTKLSIRLTRSWYVVLTGDSVDTST
jgi:hypothetical protein